MSGTKVGGQQKTNITFLGYIEKSLVCDGAFYDIRQTLKMYMIDTEIIFGKEETSSF